MQPLVTVLMPTYNSGLYIHAAMDSILQQTYPHFEFLIYDDCSTDNTAEIIESYKDKRIRFFRKEKHTGYTNSLCMGLASAQGKYIARMDSDDTSHPGRIQAQLEFLEENPDYGIVGTALQTIRENKNAAIWTYPFSDEEIRLHTVIDSPFAHPSVMIRKQVLTDHELNYNPLYEPCEDYKLWIDILKVSKGVNLQAPLLNYRLHPNQTISIKRDKLIANANLVRGEVLKDLFGGVFTGEEMRLHYLFFNGTGINNLDSIREKYKWKKKLISLFDKSRFKETGTALVEKYWLINLRTLKEFRPSLIKYMFSSSLLKAMPAKEVAKFSIKCLTGYKMPAS